MKGVRQVVRPTKMKIRDLEGGSFRKSVDEEGVEWDWKRGKKRTKCDRENNKAEMIEWKW